MNGWTDRDTAKPTGAFLQLFLGAAPQTTSTLTVITFTKKNFKCSITKICNVHRITEIPSYWKRTQVSDKTNMDSALCSPSHCTLLYSNNNQKTDCLIHFHIFWLLTTSSIFITAFKKTWRSQLFWQWCNALIINVALDFIHRHSSLQPSSFGPWFKNSYSAGPKTIWFLSHPVSMKTESEPTSER